MKQVYALDRFTPQLFDSHLIPFCNVSLVAWISDIEKGGASKRTKHLHLIPSLLRRGRPDNVSENCTMKQVYALDRFTPQLFDSHLIPFCNVSLVAWISDIEKGGASKRTKHLHLIPSLLRRGRPDNVSENCTMKQVYASDCFMMLVIVSYPILLHIIFLQNYLESP